MSSPILASDQIRCIGFIVMFGFILGILSCNWARQEMGNPAEETLNRKVEQPRDIPVPEDAEFRKDRSYVKYPAGREARVAKFVYYSDESKRYLDSFYRKNMQYGWKPSEYDVEGKGNLHFVSSNELCRINVTELSETIKRRLNKKHKIIIEIEPIDNGG